MPEEKPAETPESGGLGQLLLDLADKASGKAEGSKGSSLPAYIVFTGLVVICFAIVGFLAMRAKRRAAQLEYELRQKVEAQKRLEEVARLEENEAKRTVATKLVHEAIEQVEGLKKELAAHEAASAERVKALAQATSWDDLVVVDKRK